MQELIDIINDKSNDKVAIILRETIKNLKIKKKNLDLGSECNSYFQLNGNLIYCTNFFNIFTSTYHVNYYPCDKFQWPIISNGSLFNKKVEGMSPAILIREVENYVRACDLKERLIMNGKKEEAMD